MAKEKILAVIYDFDKTLATSDMQNFRFVKDIGMTPSEFWSLTDKFAKEHDCERILAYLYVMLEEAKKAGVKMTLEYLKSLGEYVTYYEGVLTWFDRINEYGAKRNIKVEHYIISSGNREIIKGTRIADKFTQIFACNYVYVNNEAVWPKMIVNYTSKTQCLFRISKGVLNITDDKTVNEKVPEKRVEFNNMIYIGDGVTDVPCMTLIKERNGVSVAVYKSGSPDIANDLASKQRVTACVTADYREGTKLDKLVKAKIDLMSIAYE